jgi:hypothetical protein
MGSWTIGSHCHLSRCRGIACLRFPLALALTGGTGKPTAGGGNAPEGGTMRLLITLIALTSASTAGCSTQFMGTAPAMRPGKIYVAGSDQSAAAIWLCSTNGAECQLVDVIEEE